MNNYFEVFAWDKNGSIVTIYQGKDQRRADAFFGLNKGKGPIRLATFEVDGQGVACCIETRDSCE